MDIFDILYTSEGLHDGRCVLLLTARFHLIFATTQQTTSVVFHPAPGSSATPCAAVYWRVSDDFGTIVTRFDFPAAVVVDRLGGY